MIKVGIVGYGNLGRGVCLAVKNAPDMECVGVFTRRNPENVKTITGDKVYTVDQLPSFKGLIDVLLLCGGSATDLPNTTVRYLRDFNTVDSFDTHAKIPDYYNKLKSVAKDNGTLCAISIGWDPGIFSMARLLFSSVLPNGKDYTFWGKGVSQGHSDAIRRIEGVKNAIQYTIPNEKAIEIARSGKGLDLTAREKHFRECFVVAEENADKERIEKEIKNMPNYFADYDTTVHFISEEELQKEHSGLPHGGFVIRTGKTTEGVNAIGELSLKLDSNPEFTGSVLTAYGRAVARLHKEGKRGVLTVFDIPLSYLSPIDNEDLRKSLL